MLGLHFYGARWYDSAQGRFVQPDSVVPLESQGVQAWDRYAYVNNNPVRYNDPTGHWLDSALDIFSVGYGIYDISQNGLNWENGLGLAADIVGLALPAVTGLGAVVRATTKVDDAIDTARIVDAAINIVQTANQADNTLDVLTHVDDVPTIKLGSSGGPTAGQPFSTKVRNQAFADDPSTTCVWCGRPSTGTDVDHAIPRSRGGNATIENAQLSCPHCNRSIGAKDFPVTPPRDYEGPWPPSHWNQGR